MELYWRSLLLPLLPEEEPVVVVAVEEVRENETKTAATDPKVGAAADPGRRRTSQPPSARSGHPPPDPRLEVLVLLAQTQWSPQLFSLFPSTRPQLMLSTAWDSLSRTSDKAGAFSIIPCIFINLSRVCQAGYVISISVFWGFWAICAEKHYLYIPPVLLVS
jgi:hypothetical protein